MSVTPHATVASWLTRWASGLRFPWLVGITAALFLIDLFVPDFVPLADEILLGLLTMIFASIRRRREPDTIDVDAQAADDPAEHRSP